MVVWSVSQPVSRFRNFMEVAGAAFYHYQRVFMGPQFGA